MADQRSPTLDNVLRRAMESHQMNIHTALPGRVETYDAATQLANVKPLIKRAFVADEVETLEPLPIINNVPVQFPRAGIRFISLPIKVGDHVLLVFNERSIDKWQAGSGDDTDPTDLRMHNLSDAVAIPGFYPDSEKLDDADPDNIVIGEDGGVQVHVADDKIELGEKGSSDKASLDSKVQIELTRIAVELSALTTFVLGHLHLGVTVGAGVSGPPSLPPPTPGSPAATASTLVTIKE